MKPTSTPWGYDLGHTIAQIDGDGWGDSVCQLPVGTHDRAPTAQESADMEFICQAVNHHAELVAALRDTLAAITEAQPEAHRLNEAAGETVFNPTAYKMMDSAQHKARSLLAKLAP